MSGVNKVFLVGYLGQDPETRYTQSGTAVTNFSIATTESWKDKNTGEKKEKTEWHRIVAWQKLAEVCGEYLSKGRQVYIEGKLQTRSWEDDGVTKYTTEIVASSVNFLSGGNETSQESRQEPRQENTKKQEPTNNTVDDDDIPF